VGRPHGGSSRGWLWRTGSGLRGLDERVEALGGTLAVERPPADGTLVRAQIPLA
jgi:signal transduction histidine kinase